MGQATEQDLARAASARRRSPGDANAVSPSSFRLGSIRASPLSALARRSAPDGSAFLSTRICPTRRFDGETVREDRRPKTAPKPATRSASEGGRRGGGSEDNRRRCGAGAADRRARRDRRELGRARIFLAPRFRRRRRGGRGGDPRPDCARQGAVQGQVHHRGRGGAAEGDPGDRADQAQVRRQSRLRPHQRPGLEFVLRLPQRPDRRRHRRLRHQRVRLGRVRERAVRLDRSLVLERAAHDGADGRRAGRAARARDDGRPAGRARRRGQAGARQRPGRARRSRQQGRAVRFSSPRTPTASSTSIRSKASTPT